MPMRRPGPWTRCCPAGAGINTQRVLPFGTPDEVATETRRIIDILGKGGGYILNSVHNIQSEVPPENIVAMFETGRAHHY